MHHPGSALSASNARIRVMLYTKYYATTDYIIVEKYNTLKYRS